MHQRHWTHRFWNSPRRFWRCLECRGKRKVAISHFLYYPNLSLREKSFTLFRFTVVGVSSYGVRGPPSPAPEVYARITPEIKNWIKQRAKNAQDSICSITTTTATKSSTTTTTKGKATLWQVGKGFPLTKPKDVGGIKRTSGT